MPERKNEGLGLGLGLTGQLCGLVHKLLIQCITLWQITSTAVDYRCTYLVYTLEHSLDFLLWDFSVCRLVQNLKGISVQFRCYGLDKSRLHVLTSSSSLCLYFSRKVKMEQVCLNQPFCFSSRVFVYVKCCYYYVK